VVEVLGQAALLARNVAELSGRHDERLAVDRADEVFVNVVALVELQRGRQTGTGTRTAVAIGTNAAPPRVLGLVEPAALEPLLAVLVLPQRCDLCHPDARIARHVDVDTVPHSKGLAVAVATAISIALSECV
jgi:hypothetical protein